MNNIQIGVSGKWQIPVLLSVVILYPYPTWEHFIWPLEWCVLADICNHTWVPECGIENVTIYETQVHKRLFIDECDMFEYNCDNMRDFVLTNYSLCFGAGVCMQPSLRMGDYRMEDNKRRLIFDPTDEYGHPHSHPTTHLTFPTTTKPNLPAYMLSGRRRYTPYGPNPHTRQFTTTKKYKRNARRTQKSTKKHKTKTTRRTPTTKRATVVLKRMTFKKNGKTYEKIVKGFTRRNKTTTKAKTTKARTTQGRIVQEDSDFME